MLVLVSYFLCEMHHASCKLNLPVLGEKILFFYKKENYQLDATILKINNFYKEIF